MSARVTTHTLFTDKECLLDALKALGVNYTLVGNLIITDRVDYYGSEIFSLVNGEYGFIHDSTAVCNKFVDTEIDSTQTVVSNRGGITITTGGVQQNVPPQLIKEYPWNLNHLKNWTSVGEFLSQVDSKYSDACAKKQQKMTEREKIIEEEKKKQIIEVKRQQIIENAKQKGYAVKEIKNGKQVQLILTRTSY